MKDNHFPVLILSIGFSVLVLVLVAVANSTSGFNIPPWLALACALAPLIYYHLMYLAPRARVGISQTAIDSVYYYGFLITVAALGISAISISTTKGTDWNTETVVYQFGVGLFATGYAIIARMHLTSIASTVDDRSIESIMDRYVKRSLELVDNVETAAIRIAEFSKTAETITTDIAEKSRATAERSMLRVANVFEQEMLSTLALARDGLTEIRGLVADTTFTTEREELARSITATIEISTKLNKALDEYTTRAQASAAATKRTAESTLLLDESIQSFRRDVEAFGGENGALKATAASVRDSGAAIDESSRALAGAAERLHESADAISDTGATFKSMRTIAKKASEQLDALADVTVRLDSALTSIGSTANASGKLADQLSRVSESLKPLDSNISGLSANFVAAGLASERLEKHMSTLPEQAATVRVVGESLGAVLKKISASINETAESTERLAESSAESLKAFTNTGEVLGPDGDLQASVDSLNELLNNLASSINTVQSHLANSAEDLQSAVATSTKALEADVTRSKEATAMLTDQLIQVAQTVIDRTRTRQG